MPRAQRASAQAVRVSLEEAIRRAQAHAFGIKATRHDSLAAVYDLRAAKSLRFPTLSVSSTAFYKSELPELRQPTGNIEIGAHENYLADVALSLPLFTGGRISRQIDWKRENAQAVSSTLEADRLENAFACRGAYLHLMLTEAFVKSAEASLSRIEIIRSDVQNLFSNGLADSVDLLDAELSLQEALDQLSGRQTERSNASAALSRLIGLPAEETIAPVEPVPDPQPVDFSGDVPEIDRAELRALDHQIRAASFRVSLERARYFPALRAFAGYTTGKPNQDLFNKTWNDYFSTGLSLSWEFNLGGSTRHEVGRALASVRSLEMSRRDLHESIRLQIEIARNNLKHAFQSYERAQNEHEIASRKYRLAKEKRDAGQLTLNRLLEQEAELTAIEQKYRASILNFHIAANHLFYASGSGKIYGGL